MKNKRHILILLVVALLSTTVSANLFGDLANTLVKESVESIGNTDAQKTQPTISWTEVPDYLNIDINFRVSTFMKPLLAEVRKKCVNYRSGDAVHIACQNRKYFLESLWKELDKEVRLEKQRHYDEEKIIKKQKEEDRVERARLSNERKKRWTEKKKRWTEKKREEKIISENSITSEISPNGNVSGYKKLKFGINKNKAESFMKDNCNKVKRNVKIIGNDCFDILGNKIALVTVQFTKGRLSVITLDFNGNLNPILSVLNNILGKSPFTVDSYNKIKKNLNEKYLLTEVNNDLNGYKVFSFEKGAIMLMFKSEWNFELGKKDITLAIDYLDKESAKTTLKAIGLGGISPDEF